MRLRKLNDKYTGWWTEECFRAQGRKWAKRLEHRHNRRLAKKDIRTQSYEW